MEISFSTFPASPRRTPFGYVFVDTNCALMSVALAAFGATL
jgi:hypothetical protein